MSGLGLSEEESIHHTFLKYANLCSMRGYVANTLGNICLRYHGSSEDMCYTKHMGVSLEEMENKHIIKVGLKTNRLYRGTIKPSIGHQLNREIFLNRGDINAVFHLHIDEIIAFFCKTKLKHLPILSIDTALVLEKPIVVLEQGINIEKSVDQVESIIQNTNIIIMPDHGITSLGATISQAYHRVNSVVAEVTRLIIASSINAEQLRRLDVQSHQAICEMYSEGNQVVYGNHSPRQFG